MTTGRSRLSVLNWISTLVLVIIGLLVFIKLTPVAKASSVNSFCDNLNQEIDEAKLGFGLPASTHNLITECNATATNVGVKARFNIAPNDLEVFLQETAAKDWQTKAEVLPEITYLDASFEAQMTSYLYADKSGEDQFLRVLVDLSNINQFTVYIESEMPL